MKHIRDPLYGYIEVSDEEINVMSQPEVQRLRRIHQLGLSFSVYPGATHTRFEHSLGVMHLAGKLAQSIGLSGQLYDEYRLAGLLHDVGHTPFSHSVEHVLLGNRSQSHESRACDIVDRLAERNVFSDHIRPDMIKKAILGESTYNIVAGTIDVDRMDYLRRDAFETGINHGNIDTETIINFATKRDNSVVFQYKTLQALEGLLTARYHMIKSVYAHHTSRIAELMLQQAVKSYIETEDIDSSEVVEIDDFQLHTRLLDSSGISHELYSSVINRHLYKRSKIVSPVDAVDQFNACIEDSIDSGELTKEHLADKFGVPDHWIIVDMPQSHKIKPIDVDIIWNNSVVSIELLSEVPRTVYDSTVNTNDISVYSHPSVRNEVTNYLQERFA